MSSRPLSIILIASVFVFSACSSSMKINQVKPVETKVAVIQIAPTPFTGQVANVKGENQAIKIADDLATSVKDQSLPALWLEFEQGKGQVIKLELDDKFKQNLKTAGQALLHYQYVINNSKNPDERYEASFNQSIAFINSLNEIRELEIDSPDGKRKLTEDEVIKILHKQSGLINDRYHELDDHFKPKSSFYGFKESVNKKFGYSIF